MQQLYVASPKPQHNTEVLIFQRQLNTIRSVLLHNLPIVREDGYYGVETAKAVKAFQQACNISADGVLGPQTQACIMQKLREMPSISAAPLQCTIGPAPSKYSIGPAPAPVQLEESSLTSSISDIVKKAADGFSHAADVLRNASKQAAEQLAHLQKYQNSTKISKADIENIMKSMMKKPSIQEIRENVKKEVMDELREMTRGNNYHTHYKGDKRSLIKSRQISDAQRQLAKGPNSQTISIINQRVAKQVVDKCAKELRSVQFDKIISQGIGKITKVPKGGGTVLAAVMLLPLGIHVGELCINLITNNPIEQNVRDIAADLVELAVGVLIGLAITALVSVFITGGWAVLVVVIVGIIIALLLSFFFDDEDNTWSDKIVNWIYETYLHLSNSIQLKKCKFIDSPMDLPIDSPNPNHLNYYA